MPTESSPLLLPDPRTERPFPTAYDSKSIDSSSSSSSSRFDHGDVLRDVIIGFSDGLTVPFALTAGLSSLGSTKLVIMGGLAELFSGMISMGLGAYLAAVTERDTYSSWEEREDAHNAACLPEERRSEIHGILEKYGVSRGAAAPLVDELCANANRDGWVRFKMDFGGLRMEEPRRHRACVSGLTMGLSYLVGGLVPMVPYFLLGNVRDALLVSVAVTVVVLLAFGYVKNYVAIRDYRAGLWGAAQTLVIGVLAAGASYVIVKSLDRRDDV
ncbi:hypothetical protein C2857_007836 [Epichloe festucae Fl1]|uniref:Uncharacterized protein n=1 Tax=Epichloe festucae (strain Fl1) TaxID=877507 RepID=A0A7S9PTK8_EPIFF|nr:hypothetical protein C2857_007836 [Epichloe festucae Fl1]